MSGSPHAGHISTQRAIFASRSRVFFLDYPRAERKTACSRQLRVLLIVFEGVVMFFYRRATPNTL